MYYLIKEYLTEATAEECAQHNYPYVAIVSYQQFIEQKDVFDMGIDMDIDYGNPVSTKAEVNYDSLTGSFSIVDRNNIFGPQHRFAFALDQNGIAFINDNDGFVQQIVNKIQSRKKWNNPSLERFLYDFLESIIMDDISIFEKYDKVLDDMEITILKGETESVMEPLLEIRGEILEISTHYNQLLDLCQELLENENGFFKDENLRFFEMYNNRVGRLNDMVYALKERVIQIRDLHSSQLEEKQNKITTLLTVIATIFMPLTLIAGWYGMNFKYMPELLLPYAYPVLVVICIVIVIVSILYFKKKKWL